jgi:predicted RNA-binding protein associated with RNAse of E/G family
VLREVWRGRVFAAISVIAVADEPDLQMFYRPAKATLGRAVDPRGNELRIPGNDWRMEQATGADREVLSFAFPGTPYAVLMTWEQGRFGGWYVNLQEPLRRTAMGFDTMDHALDVLIPPNSSSWELKDEDELEEAVRIGMFTADDAAWFRHWAERAAEHILLREPPFDRDWISWRPDPSWRSPALPSGWDSVRELTPA